MNVLKSGCDAYYDTFSGLVPVKVISITGPSGFPSSEQQVEFEVTKDFGGSPALASPIYRKGERFTCWALFVVPPGALCRGSYGTRFGLYVVQADDDKTFIERQT